MAIDHHRAAAIVLRPVVTHGQAEFVGFARGFTVQRELAHASRRAALIFLLESCVRDDETAVVEHVVAHESVDEALDLLQERGILAVELGECFGESMRDAYVAAGQLRCSFTS